MDHIRILKRAFSITTTYRALWIFGILVALTAGGRISGSGRSSGSSIPGPRTWPTLSPEAVTGLIVAGVVVFVAITVGIILSLLLKLWHRAVVLEDRGVNDAVRRGWQLLRRRLGDVGVMGLILFGLGLAKTIVLVPVVFLLAAVAVIGGGLPAMLAYAVAGLIAQGATPLIAAAIVGVPIFILVMAVPLAILSGIVQTFQSSTWTLAYRELAALDAGQPSAGDLPLAPLPAGA